MKPIIKEWLKALYEVEICEVEGTIANQRMWAKGAPDDETTELHLQNIDDQEEYLEILHEKVEELENE